MFTTHFFGNEISDYGKENGRVDYETLAKAFDAVYVGSDFMYATGGIYEAWELESGSDSYFEDGNGNTYYSQDEVDEKIDEIESAIEALEYELTEEEAEENEELQELKNQLDELENADFTYYDIFQYFIISAEGARILEEYTNEIVYYNSNLDLYVWGVTHYGTSWSNVLTDIPCTGKEED